MLRPHTACCLVCIVNLLLFAQGTLHMRNKRFLIFPRQAPTRHQFIGGIGIPADLPYESLTIGHVLKAEFFLPYNASVYRENPFVPEYRPNVFLNIDETTRQLLYKPSMLRWHIYAYIENRLDSYGYNGRECMLQAICEAHETRFARHFSVVAELFQLLLSPTSSLNAQTPEAQDYIAAAKAGRDCDIYACNMKLLDWVSKVLHLDI